MSKSVQIWKDLANKFFFSNDLDEMFDFYMNKYNNQTCKKNSDNKVCKKDKTLGKLCTCDFEKNFLVDNGDYYELTMEVNPKATAKDITIDLENNSLKIEYNFKDGNMTTSNSVIETLPKDADENEITAEVDNGKLKVVVEKRPIEIEVEEDTKTIPINRK